VRRPDTDQPWRRATADLAGRLVSMRQEGLSDRSDPHGDQPEARPQAPATQPADAGSAGVAGGAAAADAGVAGDASADAAATTTGTDATANGDGGILGLGGHPDAIPTDQLVIEALRSVVDPELGSDIVDLGMVRSVEVDRHGSVAVAVGLTMAGCPLRGRLRDDVERAVTTVPGVTSVTVTFDVLDEARKRSLMDRARRRAQEQAPTTDIGPSTRVLAITSGKGGVGKSALTVNLAVALAARGAVVGLLDADIWGFSVPRLLGMAGRLTASEGRIVPLERPVGTGRLRVVSMGFLADEDTAIMWRGLKLNRAVQQFLEDVRWGSLDALLIDMPPGTGDVHMGLARMLPRTEVVVVTTPPVAAQQVAARAADMARKGHLRVAGVVENMSDFVCDHGTTYRLFGEGGGRRLAVAIGAPLLGTVPFDPAVAAGGDRGQPVVLGAGPASAAIRQLADRLADDGLGSSMEACTGRLLAAVERAAGVAPR
jgi:ATP-binding protein involved in chromosome partitioning